MPIPKLLPLSFPFHIASLSLLAQFMRHCLLCFPEKLIALEKEKKYLHQVSSMQNIVIINKCIAHTPCPGSPSPADPVDVIFNHLWEIIVDHKFYILDILVWLEGKKCYQALLRQRRLPP